MAIYYSLTEKKVSFYNSKLRVQAAPSRSGAFDSTDYSLVSTTSC